MLRDGIDAQTAQRMIATQALREQRLAAAHDVIRNDADIAALAARVEAIHKAYLGASGYAK
jgi:dephospho-CoA kinase